MAIQSFRIDAWLLAMQSFRITSDLTQWLWQVVNMRQLPPDTDSFSNNMHDFRRAKDAAITAALHQYLRVVNNGLELGLGTFHLLEAGQKISRRRHCVIWIAKPGEIASLYKVHLA